VVPPIGDGQQCISLVRNVRTRDDRKGGEVRMMNFETMTAMAPATRSRVTPLVSKDAPWNGFASMGIDQHCGRSFAPGGVV
jgi:hypothetical protein